MRQAPFVGSEACYGAFRRQGARRLGGRRPAVSQSPLETESRADGRRAYRPARDGVVDYLDRFCGGRARFGADQPRAGDSATDTARQRTASAVYGTVAQYVNCVLKEKHRYGCDCLVS